MIRPAYLTEDQWFVLCRRVYKALIADDRDHALLLLVVAGFNAATLKTNDLAILCRKRNAD